MAGRTIGETLVRSIRGVLSTPPSSWYRQWRLRNRSLPDSRAGYLRAEVEYSQHQLLVAGFEVMQDWERPLMRALAEEAARSKGHVLEVGFGMGISASYLIELGCSRYTVIEPHPRILERCRSWASEQPVPVEVVEGFWEDVIDDLGLFDGILYDVYTVSELEKDNKLVPPFVRKASEHLRPGGVFTFYSGRPDALSAAVLEPLTECFSTIDVRHVTGLRPPPDCQYYRDTRMVVPVCTR